MLTMLRSYWAARRTTILGYTVAVMSVYALAKLGLGFWRLLYGPPPNGRH